MANPTQNYINSLSQQRRERVLALQKMILDVAPDATIDMHYKMPTYHVGDQWVAMASQKFYISLYTCKRKNIENFRNACPEIRTGQGCINFKDKDELAGGAIKEVISSSLTIRAKEHC
jgi:uncharacterized protein YdhG (YjbR/CyaY superfamily)